MCVPNHCFLQIMFYLLFEKIILGNNSNINHNNSSILCEKAHRSIEEFPHDFFTEEQRQHGAIIIHLLVAFYGFIFITFVCQDYYLPSVFCICTGMVHKLMTVAYFTSVYVGGGGMKLHVSVLTLHSYNTMKILPIFPKLKTITHITPLLIIHKIIFKCII